MTPESGETDDTVSEPDEPFTNLGRHPGLSSRQPAFGGRHELMDTDVEPSLTDQRLGNQFPLQVQVKVPIHGQGQGVRH